MTDVRFPEGFQLEKLRREHPRRAFRCGESDVEDWLATKALQNQDKRLSITRVLLDSRGVIAGYYTLATGQVEFGDLPMEVTKQLPKRRLPVAILAWLGVSTAHQGKKLGARLLARALRDCSDAGQTFPFVAVILDCLSDRAKRFYQRWDFQELPGHPHRLFLSGAQLDALMLEP